MKFIAFSTAAALSLAAVLPAAAQDAAPQAEGPMEVMREADSSLTCPQISDEAAQLSQKMGGAPGNGFLSAISGVAQAGAALVIPGAGLVMAAGDALTRPDRERKEAESAAVRHRWYYLNGLYAGQDCMASSAAATPVTPADAAPPARPQ
ncbi:MAG TPA: hypothetical protein VGB60_12485 [Brevundimonas sp.]|jgi:hypothetical protein|uniref:hypothetical protein n=1 Tax=Brevundimonas sp. TaxID=1871086 RepID=UPI002ED8744B